MSSKTKAQSWADEIREWRFNRSYTQEEAAAHLLVRTRTYEEWEQDRAEPSHKAHLRLLMRTARR